MRVVSWNANRKFREKFQMLDDYYQADLYIIQECEDPMQTNHREYQQFAHHHLWMGKNKNIGLGAFAMRNNKIRPIQLNAHYLNYMMPFLCNGRLFLGIWSHGNYVEDLVVYFSIHKLFLMQKPIVIGDFNSNAKWDRKHSNRSHSVMNSQLENAGLISVYHYLTGEKHGEERMNTYYQWRHYNRGYHIDYAYAPQDEIKSCRIGDYDTWGDISDHMPIVIEIQ